MSGQGRANRWTLEEARAGFDDLLEAARTSGPQLVEDPKKQGIFTVSFSSTEPKPSTVKFLLEDSAE
ncbi:MULTISPECIES: hypothetical protein [Agrobacterium]|uniref:hypothetical protein n=1 Tax=Agrobacterium tumefaciens TaxID=358 RepID=UPI001573A9D0|nr:hypothetical protein [Agrobacterium tumefaciens]NSZ06336.1 hypothetical protein [Agrobacterium tumefaciens]